MLAFIVDTTRFSLFTQSVDMNKCVAPMSMVVIKGISLIKHVPRMKLFVFETSFPLRLNTFPVDFASDPFLGLWNCVLI